MRTANQFLILTVITTVFTVPALAKDAPSLPEDLPRPLIGRPHPELIGIKALYFDIVMPKAETKEHASTWDSLKNRAENMLKDAGIDLVPQIHDGIAITSPELKVNINMLKLDDSQQCVVHIQTCLSRNVVLKYQPALGLKADVWKTDAVMRLVPIRDIPSSVTNVILWQVDAFIFAHRLARLASGKSTDANDIATVLPVVTPRQTTPVVKPTTAKYKYVASKNSKVFHKADCRWAQRIKPTNLVTFSTREQAIQAGKRPCKQCKP